MLRDKQDEAVIRVLDKVNLMQAYKIADSLQGSVWRAQHKDKNEQYVIKVTNQYLHHNAWSVLDNKLYKVNENILVEQSILKYVTHNTNCPPSIVKFDRFFKTSSDYYLIMRDGGGPLMEFVMKAHKLISTGKIDVSHWRDVVRVLCKQMIECVSYLHSLNVVHFDLSLENFVINDVPIQVECGSNYEKIFFDLDDIQIQLCDFGLAELFTSATCVSSKCCGKLNYASPEVVEHKTCYDAKANDIFCMGVCMFMIVTGLAPWDIANDSEDTFCHIVQYKRLQELLTLWNVSHYVDEEMLWFLQSVLQYEQTRISLLEIKQRDYFTK